MNKLVLAATALALIGSLALLGTEPTKFLEEDEMMTRFRNFKVQYNKKYDSADEDTIRFLIFSENYQIIEKLNEHNHSFRVAVNKFADLTSAEFKSLYLGYKKSAQSNARVEYLNTTDLPDQVDWRQLVNPVKNQGQCGSCWAFSAVAGLEAVYALNTKEVLSFSEQQVVDCSRENGGCNGGDLPPAYDYLVSKGIELDSKYPYKARDQICRYNKANVVFKPSGYVEVPSQDNDQLAAAVAQQPVPVCIEADTTVFQYYSEGVLDSDDCGTELDHCVEIVGYDTEAWIVRNSWGADWGLEGHVRIKKESGQSAGICGIALEGVYPKY